jgi:hypothetical protein
MGVIVRLRGVLGLEVDVRMVGVALLGVAVLVPVAKPQVLEDTAVLEEIVRHVVVVVPMCHGLMAVLVRIVRIVRIVRMAGVGGIVAAVARLGHWVLVSGNRGAGNRVTASLSTAGYRLVKADRRDWTVSLDRAAPA